MRKIISENAPKAIGPYVHANIVGNLVFTSGQLGINLETGKLEEDLEKQIHLALRHLSEVLKTAGSDMNHVVKTTIYLSDMDNFQTLNKIYAEYFNENLPARTAYEVAKLPMDAKVEIEAIGEIVD